MPTDATNFTFYIILLHLAPPTVSTFVLFAVFIEIFDEYGNEFVVSLIAFAYNG